MVASKIQIVPASGALGAEILGVDLSKQLDEGQEVGEAVPPLVSVEASEDDRHHVLKLGEEAVCHTQRAGCVERLKQARQVILGGKRLLSGDAGRPSLMP